ncbi:MAG: peptidase M14 [Pseudomonadota bacterium]
MTIIYQGGFDRILDRLVADFGAETHRGKTIEAWLFEDEPSRRAAEQSLAAFGVQARIRSAYKPLLHFFLEDINLDGLAEIVIGYPEHTDCAGNRFLLETYPLAALVGDAKIRFVAVKRDDFIYDVTLTRADGHLANHSVFAPNRHHLDAVGETCMSPTGWIRITDADGDILRDERIETDYERLFETGIQAIAGHDWGHREPYFEELNIRVTLPGRDRDMGYGFEAISLHEALHEDFYFSLLEFFQKKSGRPLGDRGLQPGQIIPEIIHGDGAPTLTIETRPYALAERSGAIQNLEDAQTPLSADQIRDELAAIDGEPFETRSYAGRPLRARYHRGSDAAVMISGGQHPNETSGIVGALRAARILAARPGAHFTISPLENPDGYAVHQRLCADNPAHMHHAARYTALGDDLEYRKGDRLYEKEIRVQAERLSGAQLHVNLHGYPAHEWTRPLSGYVPRGFGMWTLPKGFFLIMRHHAAWDERAENFIDRVTKSLVAVPGLVAFNRAQIDLYEIHAGETGFRIINGFPCLVSVDDRHEVPLTLITEYPDETVYDGAFVAGHTTQMATVLAAYDAYQAVLAENIRSS